MSGDRLSGTWPPPAASSTTPASSPPASFRQAPTRCGSAGDLRGLPGPSAGDQGQGLELGRPGTGVTADVGEFAAFARDHNPNTSRLLDQPDSKTTHLPDPHAILSVLAEAWSDPIRSWLHHPTGYRPLILQHDPGDPELSRIWIGSMLGLLASAVGSPTLTESRERRSGRSLMSSRSCRGSSGLRPSSRPGRSGSSLAAAAIICAPSPAGALPRAHLLGGAMPRPRSRRHQRQQSLQLPGQASIRAQRNSAHASARSSAP